MPPASELGTNTFYSAPLAPCAVPPIVVGGVAFVCLAILSAALGRRLLLWLRIHPEDMLEHAAFAVGLGLGALQAIPFLLFALGIGRPIFFRVVIAVVALVLLPDILAAARAVRRSAVARRRWRWPQWVLAASFTILAALLFLRTVCPVTDDDALSYHLTAAIRFLAAGRFVYIPTITPTNWPVGTESLFAMLLGLHPAIPVKIVPFTLGLVMLAATYAMGRRLCSSTAGWIALALLLLYVVPWEQMASALVDGPLAAFASLAVLAIMMVGEVGEVGEVGAGTLRSPLCHPRALRLAAVCAGFAAAAKLTGVWVIVALTIVVLLTEPLDLRARVRRSAGFVGIAAAVAVPWFLRTWVLTGNPLYPMLYGVFGGREWSAGGWPRYLEDHLLFNTVPGVPPTTGNLEMIHLALAGAGALVAVAVVLNTRRSPIALPARCAAILAACILLGSYYNLRFMLPALPAVCACVAYGLARLRYVLPIAAILAMPMAVSRAQHAVLPALSVATRVAFGITGRSAYLASVLPDYPVVEYANMHCPPDSVILVGTWEKSTALYRAAALWPDYWLQDSLHYDSVDRLLSDCRRMGVTHVVFRPMDDPWCSRSYHCTARRDHETVILRELLAVHGELLFIQNGVSLYRLK